MWQEDPIQAELQRQALLAELDLVAWVAQTPLLGAISSPVLGEKPSAAPTQAATASAAPAPAAAPVSGEDALAAVRQGLGTATKAPEEPEATVAPTPKGEPYVFTLQAYFMPFGILLAQQQDPNAPGFNRDELQLLKNFAGLWGGLGPAARTFKCPVGPMVMHHAEAKDFLQGVVAALAEQCQAPNNKLLMLSDDKVAQLLVPERYHAQEQRLAISTLAEMLADPLTHKVASWRALFKAAFYASASH